MSSRLTLRDPRQAVPFAPQLRDEAGIRFGLAHAVLVAAALVAGATRMPESISFAVMLIAAFTGGTGLATHWRTGIALSAWAIWTGFLGNTLGVLTFSEPDLARLAVLLVLAVVRLGP